MSIKTYAVNCNDAWLNTGGDDISGSYVKYKDHQEVVADLEAKCAALAAENAALKAFGGKLGDMHNDLNGECTGIQGRAEVAIQQVALEAAMEEFEAIKTPATDAFMAEVRAQNSDSICVSLLEKAGEYEARAKEVDCHTTDNRYRFAAAMFRGFAAQLRQEAAQ